MVAPFFPMHLRWTGVTLTDTIHKTLTGVTVLLILLIIGFGAFAGGTLFSLYSIGTIAVLIVFGTLACLNAPRIEANLPMPWVGVTERINIYGYMLWMAVLAGVLVRAEGEAPGKAPVGEVLLVLPDE